MFLSACPEGVPILDQCASQQRLEALAEYEILDTPEEQGFSELATLAADIFEAPIAAVTLIDIDRQWFKAKVGIDVCETPLNESMCVHGLTGPDLLVVPNALEDARFASNPAVFAEDGVRFYAGARITSHAGIPLGMICVADTEPRAALTATQERMLRALAGQVLAQLELKRECRQRTEATEQASKARLEAEAATAAKAMFLANMSHEIRTPLNSVIGFTDLLLDDASLSDRVRRQLDLIKNSGSALLTVINGILDFSKLEAGRPKIEEKPFSVHELVHNTCSIIQQQAEAKGLDLRLTIDNEIPSFYIGDFAKLRQVLLNLLSNAVKFTSQGAVCVRVDSVSAAGSEAALRFCVSDTGPGVPREHESKLFRQFSQADASISRKHGGTGLGLAICKGLIDAMGGRVGYRANQHGGSEFWFTLPLMATSIEPTLNDEASPQVASSQLRVLLVEDLPLNQELMREMLGRLGHVVRVASNGREAVLAAQESRFDIILMDVQMPVMDGITATQLIRLLPGSARTTPVIALTANVLPEQIAEFRQAGMSGHLSKPVRLAVLKQTIDENVRTLVPLISEPIIDVSSSSFFDKEVFSGVAKILPRVRLKAHLENFEKELISFGRGDLDNNEMSTTAHKLISQAGMLGFSNLSQLFRDFCSASDLGQPVEAVILRLQAVLPLSVVKIREVLINDRDETVADTLAAEKRGSAECR